VSHLSGWHTGEKEEGTQASQRTNESHSNAHERREKGRPEQGEYGRPSKECQTITETKEGRKPRPQKEKPVQTDWKMEYQRSGTYWSPGKGTIRVRLKPGRLLEVWLRRTQNLRVLLLQHQERNRTTPSTLEGISRSARKAEALRRTRGLAHSQAAKGRSSRDHGGRQPPTMGQ